MKPPRLRIVAGLHGSGKSTLLRCMGSGGARVLDDIMKHAVGDEPRFACCRQRGEILGALDDGNPLVLADSLFCDPGFRREFLDAVDGRIAPEEIDWICFEPDVRACEANIRHRAKTHGWKHPEIPLASNRRLVARFQTPAGVRLQPVHRVTPAWRALLADFRRRVVGWCRLGAAVPR